MQSRRFCVHVDIPLHSPDGTYLGTMDAAVGISSQLTSSPATGATASPIAPRASAALRRTLESESFKHFANSLAKGAAASPILPSASAAEARTFPSESLRHLASSPATGAAGLPIVPRAFAAVSRTSQSGSFRHSASL